jgi:hypothetical protein
MISSMRVRRSSAGLLLAVGALGCGLVVSVVVASSPALLSSTFTSTKAAATARAVDELGLKK